MKKLMVIISVSIACHNIKGNDFAEEITAVIQKQLANNIQQTQIDSNPITIPSLHDSMLPQSNFNTEIKKRINEFMAQEKPHLLFAKKAETNFCINILTRPKKGFKLFKFFRNIRRKR